VLNLAEKLPSGVKGRILADQTARARTLVAEFISKLGVAEEEADEGQFSLEMIAESKSIPRQRLIGLHKEACEATAIFAASRKSAMLRR
jgi:hypothetical protein